MYDSPFRCAWAAWTSAWPRIPSEGLGALKRIILPVGYWRAIEFAFVGRHLDSRRGLRALDVGSPKELPFQLARLFGYAVTSIDIVPAEVDALRATARAAGRLGRGRGQVWPEIQDGRSLPYPDATFDLVTSVSVLEHMPENGDSAAIHEIARVLVPGGRFLVTVPFAPKCYDTFVDRDVYERTREGSESVFFERHYDHDTLKSRLCVAKILRHDVTELWGEGKVRMESMLHRHPLVRTTLAPVEWLLASGCIEPATANGTVVPMTACLAFTKTEE